MDRRIPTITALLLLCGCATAGDRVAIPPPPTTTTWDPDPPAFTTCDCPIRFTTGGFILTWEQPDDQDQDR